MRPTRPLVLSALAAFASCRAPTEVSLALSTDVSCADLRGTSVTVGRLGEIETKAATTSATTCSPLAGDLGVLVVVPSGSKSDEVAVKVVAGVGRDADACVPPYGPGCIVARRAIRFLPHTPLRISIPLRAACNGVACGDQETCVSGACVSAEIADPSRCAGNGCDEGALGAVDAGAPPALDGAPAPATYHDVKDASRWTTFDLTQVVPSNALYNGAVFDGRYVYFVPLIVTQTSCTVLRYDTRAPFGAVGSWSTFDTMTLPGKASSFPGQRTPNGFTGATFDGRYVYLAPNVAIGGGPDAAWAVRYDTTAAFGAGASWADFDLTTVNANAGGYQAATFDGRFVYLVPGDYGLESCIAARHDTRATWSDPSSWETLWLSDIPGGPQNFSGANVVGRYVYYFANFGILARYDTQAPFTSMTSWTFVNTSSVGVPASYLGSVFDGRYVYGVSSTVARYDSSAPFDAPTSWKTFDPSAIAGAQIEFFGGAFDGRFVYFVPELAGPVNGRTPTGMLVRYDTSGDFAASSAWSAFDLSTVNPNAKDFEGAAFDGQYLYLVGRNVIARFDAKTPPSVPPSVVGGSFL